MVAPLLNKGGQPESACLDIYCWAEKPLSIMAFLQYWALASYALAILLIVVLINGVRTYRRLSHIPGPKLAAFSRLWILRGLISGRFHAILGQAVQIYGPLVRIGPNHLLLGDPEVWRRICGTRSPYRRGDWYNAMRFKPRTDNVLSTRYEVRHEELKRKMAAGYSGKENHGLEQSIDARIQDLVDLIDRKYVSSDKELRRLDFGQISQFFTLDVISDVAFGQPFGDLTDDEDKFEYIKTGEENVPVLMFLTALPGLHKFMENSYIMNLVAPSVKDKTGLGSIIYIAREKVMERFGPDKKENWDMLGSFVRHGLTQEEAESETVLQIIAGSDTTATAIRSTMLYLITNPDALSQLRGEIDMAISTKKISYPITDAEAKALPYLQAVIKEGLRIHPPVAGLMEKITPPEGDVINGYQVPGGIRVGYCALAYQHHPQIYSPDPEIFRPNRWLTSPPDQIAKMERNLELVFSSGRYQCLGKNVAAVELNKVFVELLRHFNFTLCDPTKPWHSVNNGIFMQRDMWVRVTRR